MRGIYILIIRVKKPLKIKIGKLGIINFTKGNYAYIGSAQNNLEKRIMRHKSKSKKKKLHWHIDYLLNNKNSKIIKIFYKKKSKKYECIIAKKLSKKRNIINKFGCSDCTCKSHLIKLENQDLKFSSVFLEF
ncbi:MAG: GIY-YIG nuclease family protein [Candidatus Pacearchaeota archaeon]